MIAYLVLLLAVVSRIVPLQTHAWNFTALGGCLLYFGARRSPWQTVIAVLAMAGTDFYLTHFVYNYPFHVSGYLTTWAWGAGVCLLGHGLLSRKTTFARTGIAVLTSATSFFVISNFAVWAGSALYPHTFAGLTECYTVALPFYGNDLVSTGLVAGALFGLPALSRKLSEAGSHGSAAA